MMPDPYDIEHQLQAAADQPSNPTDEPAVARHRYVLHAIRQLPVPQPPADFARQMELQLRDHPENAATERWLLGIAAIALLALTAATIGPWLATAAPVLNAAASSIPWRFLTAVGGGLACFAVLDALRTRPGSA